MKYGISMSNYDTNFGPVVFRTGTLKERIEQAVLYGYDGVDLFSNISDNEQAKEAAKEFAAAGLEVAMYIAIALAEGGVNLTCTDQEQLEEYKNKFQGAIDFASILGAHKMPVGFLRGKKPDTMPMPEYYERLAESLQELAAYGKEREVELCLEPINRYEINTFNSAVEAAEYLEKYPIDNVSLLLDAFHMNIEDSGIPEAIYRCKGYIGHFHLPDNNRFACGSGSFDFAAIIGALKSVGYDGYLSVEAFPVPDAAACARNSIECLKRFAEGGK